MSAKLRLDIPVILPEVPDAADACVGRLMGELTGRPGIEQVHVVKGEALDTPAQLCVHYDPDTLSLARINDIVAGAGAKLTEAFGHLAWNVDGIGHQRKARSVSQQLMRVKGVLEVEASAAGTIRIEYDRDAVTEEALRSFLGQIGVHERKAHGTKARPVTPGQGEAKHDAEHSHEPGEKHDHGDHDHGDGEGGHEHAHGGIFGPNSELIFALLCGALLGIGFAIEKLVAASAWVPLAFFVGAYAFGGYFTLREAIDNLKLKRFEIDTLMLVAAAGAAALGAWAEGALLLFLFSLGHALEHYAMGRAKRAIEALAELAPQTALVRRDGKETEIPVEELEIGDTVIVKPDERIAADGFLIKGTSSVNQAPVTGESMPVDKRPVVNHAAATAAPETLESAYRVFAGTINGSGLIEIEVTRKSSDSALAKVVKMVSEAETQRSPTQRFTDRFERIFVPSVLALTVALLFAWVVVDEPFRDSFYRAMAVLVAASPCALAIATPSAVLSGVARAARGGVLVKGGGPLENLGSLNAIAFDKTGTLTEGRPRITDVFPVKGIMQTELLSIAVAVERLSHHPLARAIAEDGLDRVGDLAIPTATDLESLTGRGVRAKLDGATILIGKAEMFGTDGVAPLSVEMSDAIAKLRSGGRTTMIVRRDDKDLGAIGLMDTPRKSAKDTLARLRKLGITRMIMISGDNQKVAEAIAAEVGIDEAIGDLMPEDKVEAIRKLRDQGKVAMVGDGVNDAPAMANATVGIAMGAAGSDVALETADVALMADDLAHLPFAVGLSRSTRAIIRQNVFVSLGVVALLVPATILGLGIGPAVAAHEGSTLLVVFNALRLLAYRDRGA
jgi:Zn2+/Cd2+-exporting ATPase